MCREVCFARLLQPFARFQLKQTLSDGVARAVAQTLACRRFCGLRSFASGIFSAFVRTSNGSRNGTNRKRLAILPHIPRARMRELRSRRYAGCRALSISVAVNRMHMVPLPFATGNNAETRDRELKARWAGYSPMKSRIRRVRAGWLHELESAHVRRILLAAVEFGGDTSLHRCTFCASARDSMAKFDRFLLFSASPEQAHV